MTANEKLAIAKARLGFPTTANDALLTQYLIDAEYFILGVTGQPVLPVALEGVQIDLAVSAWGKRGAEGRARIARAVYPSPMKASPPPCKRF